MVIRDHMEAHQVPGGAVGPDWEPIQSRHAVCIHADGAGASVEVRLSTRLSVTAAAVPTAKMAVTATRAMTHGVLLRRLCWGCASGVCAGCVSVM